MAEPLRPCGLTVTGGRCGVITPRTVQVGTSGEARLLRRALCLRCKYPASVLHNRRDHRMFDLAFH